MAAAKAERDYGGALSRVVDLIGGTCVLPDDGDYGAAVEALRAALPEGASIAKVKKLGFGSPEACYQDVKVSIRFANGGIGEVILVSEHMQDAKLNRGGHAVYELSRVLRPLAKNNPEAKAAFKATENLSSAIYSRTVDSAAFARAKEKASSALQSLKLESIKASLSAEDMMIVKSSDSLLNLAKPLSVNSAAIPSSSEIEKGISPDRVAKSASKVKNKLEQSAQKVKDEAPGADADGVLRVWLREQDHTRAARSGGSPSGAGDLLAELTMREYLRPLAATLKEAKERGESYAAIKKRLTAPLTNAATLAHGLAAAFNAGRFLPQGEDVAAANPYGCNQYGEGWAEPHDGNSTGYQQMGPGKPERKVLTTEHGGNKVEKVTHDKRPGKGANPDASPEGLDKAAKEAREKRTEKSSPVGKAKTREEAIEHAKSYLNGEKDVHFDEMVPLEMINAINEKMTEMVKKYPSRRLEGIGSYRDAKDGVLARANGYRIEINHNAGTKGIFISGELSPEVGGNRKGVGFSVVETIAHEYAHILQRDAENAKKIEKFLMSPDEEIREGAALQKKWESLFKSAKNSGFSRRISTYAGENNYEFFAECFAYRETGGKLPEKINTAIDNIIKYGIRKKK